MHNGANGVGLNCLAPRWVGLDPRCLLPRVVLGIDRVDEREEPIVDLRALQNPHGVIPELLADSRVVAGGGRDGQQHRMPALAHRGQQDVIDLAGLVRGDLVADRDLHVEAIQRLCVRADRPEVGARPFLPDRIGEGLDPIAPADLRRPAHHLAGCVEQDPRLVAGHRGRVALSAALAIEQTQVKGERSSNACFAVPARNEDNRLSESPRRGAEFDEAEQVREHEALPRHKAQRPARFRALDIDH